MPHLTRRSPRSTRLDAFRTTGPSPTSQPGLITVHLLGAGGVGCELLRRLDPQRYALVAVSDRSGTLHDPAGLDPDRVADWKETHGSLGKVPGASRTQAHRLLGRIPAELVVDATSTEPDRDEWIAALDLAVVARGRALVLAAKDAAAARAHQWLREELSNRIGVNAVLGGTGHLLQAELPLLRSTTRSLALAGNASTTTILEAIEDGASLDEGIERAARLGLLESDPSLDLRGHDAAVKLAVVTGAILGYRVTLADIATTDLRTLDAAEIRTRSARGLTTRLVARLGETGELTVSYEAVPRTSPLAAPSDRVVYLYEAAAGERRLHVGHGLGAAGTARALLHDIERIGAAIVARRAA